MRAGSSFNSSFCSSLSFLGARRSRIRAAALTSSRDRIPLDIVYDHEQRTVTHIKKLEKLVYTELNHFSIDPGCRRSVKSVEHHEWFEIQEEEAVGTVKIWRRFIQMSPYKSDDSLAAFWRDKGRRTRGTSHGLGSP
jgi:T5orf172 domain